MERKEEEGLYMKKYGKRNRMEVRRKGENDVKRERYREKEEKINRQRERANMRLEKERDREQERMMSERGKSKGQKISVEKE